MGLPRAMYSMIFIIVEMSFISHGLSGLTQISAVERISNNSSSGTLPVKLIMSSRPLSTVIFRSLATPRPSARTGKMNVEPP